jgi:hypothetical protein
MAAEHGVARVRPPAVAGTFYPREPGRLAAEIDRLLDSASRPMARNTRPEALGGEAAGVAEGSPTPPKAVVAPHAGIAYSGPIAASAFRLLAPARGRIRRVVLLGPSHFVPFHGLAAPSAETFATPLAQIPLDREALARLADLPQVAERDDAHAREHSLELHLPFLQRALGEFALVPLAVGRAEPEEVAAVLDRLWDGEETVISLSSDLSHYLPYEQARRRDRATAEAILALRGEAIGRDDACGREPLRGLLHAARARGLAAELLDLRSSGDTAGDRDSVVGYGAFALRANGGGALAQ